MKVNNCFKKSFFGWRRSRFIQSFVLAAMLLTVFLPSQAVLAVPENNAFTVSPGQSIQNVLDNMAGGDTCIIRAGTYHESLNIPRSGLTLKGQGNVIIDAGGAANAISINNISSTTLEGITIKNSSDSLIYIAGEGAVDNVIRNNTLLEWGVNGSWAYPAAVHLEQGASGADIESNFMYRGNYEYEPGQFTIDAQSILFWGSNGRHTIKNNIVVGVCLDIDPSTSLSSFINNPSGSVYAHALKKTIDFGDGYPFYKLNLGDGMGINERFVQSADFDDTIFSGNHVFGAHDNMFEIQAADRNTIISRNYIDSMGGSGAIAIRSGSIGPIHITGNIIVNFGIDAFKYGSWDLGSARADKYINNNIFYSTLGRSYGGSGWYHSVVETGVYSRVLDGEVNGADYDNVHMDGNQSYTRNAFVVLAPGSGLNNSFTNNHFATMSGEGSPVKWFGSYISFDEFNSQCSGNNQWKVISRPSEPSPPKAGAPDAQ